MSVEYENLIMIIIIINDRLVQDASNFDDISFCLIGHTHLFGKDYIQTGSNILKK